MNRRQMDAALEKAFAAYEKGSFAKAEKEYDQCRAALRFFHTRAQRMNLLLGMSYVKSALKKHDEARACCAQFLRHSRVRKGRYIALHQSSLVEKEAGDLRKALSFLDEEMNNLQTYHRRDDQKHAICQHERAQVLLALGLKQDADYALQNALERAEASRDEMTIALCARALGLLKQSLGENERAAQCFEKARQQFTEAEDRPAAMEMERALADMKAEEQAGRTFFDRA